MPFPNEHALRLQPPGRFDRDSFRRTRGGTLFGGRLKVPSSIGIIWAKIKGKAEPGDPPVLQALRFPTRNWTADAARAWVKTNLGGRGRFEAAGPSAPSQATEQVISEEYVGDSEVYDQAETMAFEEVDPELYDDPQTAANEQMEQLSEMETQEENMDRSRQRYDDDEDKKPDKLYDVTDVEILAVGTWKGDVYTAKDLDHIVSNFSKLRNLVKPPAKLGHGPQKLLQTAGLPAAGWVDSLRRVGQKLLADFTDVPRVIYRALTNKSYKRVSPEVYQNYQDPKGVRHGLVLAGVALLGTDIPAIKTLKDIDKLYDATEDAMALYNDNNERNELRRVDYMPKEDETTEGTTEEETAEESTEETTEEETQEASTEETTEEATTEEETTETEEPAPNPTPDPAIAAKMAEMATKMAEMESLAETRNGILETLQNKLAEQTAAACLAEDEKFLDEIIASGKFPPAHRTKALALFTALRTDTEATLTYSEGEGDTAVDVDTTPLALFQEMLEAWPETINMDEAATGEDGVSGTSTKKVYGDGSLPLKGEDTVAAVAKYMEENPEAEYEEALMEVSRTQKK